jgi:hypothetical protein
MAKLYVTEYPDTAGAFAQSALQVVREPPLNDQTPVAIGASSLSSAPFTGQTRVVRLHTDVVCSILIGPPGTVATANNQRLAANQTEYKMVVPGNIVSVITNT